uniref:Uncharacterized protein n=1 Tax=Setaria viridis TaxID=4556 RepID=A0A4U6VUZ5_SETVI|nr:hypothetical protein SEVIR_3G343100v2 [Setaria viridis]
MIRRGTNPLRATTRPRQLPPHDSWAASAQWLQRCPPSRRELQGVQAYVLLLDAFSPLGFMPLTARSCTCSSLVVISFCEYPGCCASSVQTQAYVATATLSAIR